MPHLGCGEDAEDNENSQIKGKKFKQSKTDAFFLKNLKFCVIGEKKEKWIMESITVWGQKLKAW